MQPFQRYLIKVFPGTFAVSSKRSPGLAVHFERVNKTFAENGTQDSSIDTKNPPRFVTVSSNLASVFQDPRLFCCRQVMWLLKIRSVDV
jgi:hypothetical protein